MIIRALAGLVLGIGYGLLAGALTFLLFTLTADRPGPMIPDYYGWGRMVTMYTALITGVCGAFLGLVVGLAGVSKVRGGMIGAALGLVVLLPFLLGSWPGLSRLSLSLWKEFLKASFFLFLFFPLGLALTGIVVSVVARRLKP